MTEERKAGRGDDPTSWFINNRSYKMAYDDTLILDHLKKTHETEGLVP